MHAISGCKLEFILTSVLPACPHAERHVSVSAHMFPVGLPPPMGRRAQKHVPAAPVPYVGARASKIRYFTWYESAGRQEQARRDSETLPIPAGDGRKWGDRRREYSTAPTGMIVDHLISPEKSRIADRTSECLCRRDFACPELNPGGAQILMLVRCASGR